ncbi:hypothetical protein B0H14DRAFT_2925419, partial [Mycena olivaceomarginata]
MDRRPGTYLVVFVYISLPFCHCITMSSSSSCPCHLDHEWLLAAYHLEQNKKAQLWMAQCVAFYVLISSYVRLRSKSRLPSALECIELGIGK